MHGIDSTVPSTGLYRLASSGGVLLPTTVWCVKGKQFPAVNATVRGEVRFVLETNRSTS